MLTHPDVLELLRIWKLSEDKNIPKDLLVLLIHKNNKITIEELYNILYKYKRKRQKKEIDIKNIQNCIKEWFNIEDGGYKLKDNLFLSNKTIKLISKSKPINFKIDSLKIIFDSLKFLNSEMAIKVIEKILEQFKDSDNNLKRLISILESFIKSKKSCRKESLADSSILSFVTKKEKLINFQSSRFIPLQFDDTVYIYNLRNPNFLSLRRRGDLINPVKKIFIKLSSDFRMSIYKKAETCFKTRNSLKCFLNVDYDEDSTIEDEEGEDIVSEENETDEEESSENEWVEKDIFEKDLQKNQKRPQLGFPTIPCIKNTNFDENWINLPLKKQLTFSEEEKLKIQEDKNLNYKELSNKYMIHIDIIKKILNL